MEHRAGKCNRSWIALAGEAFYFRAAGVGEVEEACHFIERLARSVVAGLA